MKVADFWAWAEERHEQFGKPLSRINFSEPLDWEFFVGPIAFHTTKAQGDGNKFQVSMLIADIFAFFWFTV